MAAHKRKRAQRTVRSEAYGRGSVYQDRQGRWYFQPPPFEKRRFKPERCESEDAATLAQANHLAQRKAKVDLLNTLMTAAWFDFWFTEHVLPDLKPKSAEWYRFIIGKYIVPAIGHKPLKEVNGDHLIKLQNILRKHLAPSVVRRVNKMMDKAFKKAVVLKKIPHNPMDAVEPPRVPRTKKEALTMEQVAKLREEIEGDRLELLYDLMLLQGLRRGEALGLLISEYDRKRGTIRISGQIQTIEGRTRRSGSPKSDNSIRELPLTPRQRMLAERQLDTLAEERRAKGMDWKEHGLLFPSSNGTPIIPRNLNRHWYGSCVRAGVVPSVAPEAKPKGTSGPKPTKRIATGKPIPLHNLRHTAASRLDAVGASPAVTAAILGHGPGSVTASYIHPSINSLLDALLSSEREMLRRAA